MLADHSFGIIPVRKTNGEWQYLLIQHQASHWGFPKGHAEADESPKEAGERELYEETGLSIQKYLSNEPFQEQYVFSRNGKKTSKTVQYYIAEVSGTVRPQESELKDFRWVGFDEGIELATFPEGKDLLKRANAYLTTFS